MLHDAPRIDHSQGAAYRWAVFAMLFALMVVDYVDRQIVASMFPLLKAQWRLSDAQLGALVSIVSFMVAVGTVPLSFLADRLGRARGIFAMALVWSFATIACGFAQNYPQLVAARAMVGIGEAAYGAVGAALLASLFPARLRSTVVGAFLAAAVVGSVAGVALGGILSERWGWQSAFGVAGVPGVILALIFIALVRDFRLPKADGDGLARSALAALRVSRTLVLACVGGGLQLVIVSVVYAWMPTYLNRFYGLPLEKAATAAALIVLISGVGVLLGGVVADRLTSRMSRARLAVPAVVAFASAALFFIAFDALPAGALQLAIIVAGSAIMAGSIGPLAAVAIDVTVPQFRATSASLLALTQNLFGLTAGPLFAGVLSDRHGLVFSLSVVPICSLLAGAFFLAAGRSYDADVRRAAGAKSSNDRSAGALA